MDPRTTAATLYATGRWLLDSGRPNDAARIFRTLLLTTPEDDLAWLALSACHASFGQTELAARLAAQAEALRLRRSS